MSAVAIEIVIIVLLVIINGGLALAEMAIVSSRKSRLERMAAEGDGGALAALKLVNAPNQLLSTVQIGITLVGILAGAFGGATLVGVLAHQIAPVPIVAPYAEAMSLGLVVLGITYVTVVFGELVPKRAAMASPERIASRIARPMLLLSIVARPAVHLLSASTDLVLRVLRLRPSGEASITEDEISLLLEQGRQAGVFLEVERATVDRVFRLGDRRAGALMSARPEVVWLDVAASPEEIRAAVTASKHAVFPVCQGGLDHVVGVVAARDILVRAVQGAPVDLRALLITPLFIPESFDGFRVLALLKRHECGLGVVVDEHGGVEGVITLTDILQALVGKEPGAARVVRVDSRTWRADGAAALDELQEALREPLIAERAGREFHTVGGLAMHKLGRIPVVGDAFEVSGHQFQIASMVGNRVEEVLISRSNA